MLVLQRSVGRRRAWRGVFLTQCASKVRDFVPKNVRLTRQFGTETRTLLSGNNVRAAWIMEYGYAQNGTSSGICGCISDLQADSASDNGEVPRRNHIEAR